MGEAARAWSLPRSAGTSVAARSVADSRTDSNPDRAAQAGPVSTIVAVRIPGRLCQLGSADAVRLEPPVPIPEVREGEDERRVVQRAALGSGHGAGEVVKQLALRVVVVVGGR